MAGDVRDLRPDDQAVLVAQVVEELVVLIVRQAHRGRAQLADERHVAPVMLGQQRVADSLPVLMAGDAAQRIHLAVEQEAARRVDAERAAAKARAHAVEHLAALVEQLRRRRVQVGILQPAPQPRAADHRLAFGLPGGDAGAEHGGAIRLAQRVAQALPLARVREIDPGGHMGVAPLHAWGDGDARAAIPGQIEVRGGHADQVHIAVQPAVEREVRHLRIDALVFPVVHRHDDQGLALPRQRVGHVHAPGGVAAVVRGELLAVHIHAGGGIRPAQLQKQPLGARDLLARQGLHVIAHAARVITSAVLAVGGVPGVRQVDDIRRVGHARGQLAAHHKRPPAVQIHDFSHRACSFHG